MSEKRLRMERATTGAGEPPHKTQKGAVCQMPPQGMNTSYPHSNDVSTSANSVKSAASQSKVPSSNSPLQWWA